MAVPKARIYIRVVSADGSRPYPDPVEAGNRKLKEGWAFLGPKSQKDSKSQQFENFCYCLRFLKNGRRVYERIGNGAQQVLTAKRNLEIRLQATSQGIEPAPIATPDGRPLGSAIEEYLEKVKLAKKPATWEAYSISFGYFQESCKKANLEGLERKDMLAFAAFLRDKKRLSPRSCWIKFVCIASFLKAYKIEKLVRKGDWPSYTEEEPEIDEPEDLPPSSPHAPHGSVSSSSFS